MPPPALPALPAYAELHCISNFTFLRGVSHAEELVMRAMALGCGALAITDECSLAGVVRPHVAAKQHGLKFIIGTEIQVEAGPQLVLLATNRESYGHIAALITRARGRAVKGRYQVTMDDLERNLDHCLVLLLPGRPPSADHVHFIAQHFPRRAWIAAELHHGPNDEAQLDVLRELSAQSGLPLVAADDVHMHVRSRKALQDTLTAIRHGMTLATAGHALQPNAERHLRLREAVRWHPHRVEAKCHVVAAIQGFETPLYYYAGCVRIDHQQCAALPFYLHHRIEKVGITAPRDIGLAAGYNIRAISRRYRARVMRRVVRFRERKTRAFRSIQQWLQVKRIQRLRAMRQHARCKTKNVVAKPGVIGRQRVTHDRHRKQAGFAAAKRFGLGHLEKSGIYRGTRHDTAYSRQISTPVCKFRLRGQ